MREDCLLPDHSFSVAMLQPRALEAHPEMWKLKPAKRRRAVSPFLCPPYELFYILAIKPLLCSSGAPKADRVWFGLETPLILELFNSPEHPQDVWAALKWGWRPCVFLWVLSSPYRAPADNPQAFKEMKKSSDSSSLGSCFSSPPSLQHQWWWQTRPGWLWLTSPRCWELRTCASMGFTGSESCSKALCSCHGSWSLCGLLHNSITADNTQSSPCPW